MQFVFTYIRKPVRPKGLGRAVRACGRRGRSGRAGQERSERSPRRPHRTASQRQPGEGLSPLLRLREKRKKLQGEKWRSRYVRRILAAGGWRGRCAERVGARFALPAAAASKTPCELHGGCGAKRAVLRGSPVTCLTIHVLLSRMHLRFTADSQTFLALMEHRCELRLEIKPRCFGWSAANPWCYHPSISGKRSSWRVCCLVFFNF